MTASRTDALPLASVVTIFRDAAEFLDEAIASVLAQTWTRWELVLVDDGSVDASTEIARRAAAEHGPHIRYVEHEDHANRGMSASRNRGVAEARGCYIAFLDADDTFLPEKLERQVSELERHPEVDAVFGDTILWYAWDGGTDRMRHVNLPANTTFAPRDLIQGLVRQAHLTPATCSLLVRKRAFEAIDGFDDTFGDMYEDQVFFYKLFLRCSTRMLGGVLDRYRQHPRSHCAIALRDGTYRNDLPSASRTRFLKWASEYVAKEGGADPIVGTLERELWFERHPRLAVVRRRAWLEKERIVFGLRRRLARTARP